MAHIAVTSLLAPVGYGFLRSQGFSQVTAASGGLLVAIHPIVVVWSSYALMDGDAALMFVVGLWAFSTGRHWWASGLFLGGIWVKEVLWVGVVGVLAWALWTDWRNGLFRRWPLQISPRLAAVALPVVIGLGPLMLFLASGALTPGAPAPFDLDRLVDRIFVSVWLVPLLVAGLYFPRSRLICAAALGWATFFLVLNLTGRAVELWYIVLPLTLVLLALPAVLEELWRRRGRLQITAAMASTFVVVGILATVVLVPVPAQPGYVQPLSDHRDNSLMEAIRYHNEIRDRDLNEAWRSMPPGPVTVIDIHNPRLAVYQAHHGYDLTLISPAIVVEHNMRWGPVLESIADTQTVMMKKIDWVLHRAVAQVYADCVLQDYGEIIVFDISACPDRLDALEATFTEEAESVGLPLF